MHRTKELLQKLDEKIKFHLSEFNKLKSINEKLKLKNNQLLESNLIIQNRLNEIEKNFKALKIANTISIDEKNINETKNEINTLIKEIDLCISQLS